MQGGTDARICFVFDEASGEMRVADAGIERKPIGGTELVFRKQTEDAT